MMMKKLFGATRYAVLIPSLASILGALLLMAQGSIEMVLVAIDALSNESSLKENIVYVGTPYEMTWQDFNDPKGFHTFDTETRKLKFFENPDRVFVRIDYDDSQPMQPLDDIDLTDCFVKVVVTNKTDLYKFDQYIQNLYTKGCYEIKIVEDMTEFADGEIGEEIDLEDTMDVLSNYIDSIDTDADKDKIKQFIKTLYVEAIHVEVI